MDTWARELTVGATNDLQKATRIYDALAARHTATEIMPSKHLRTASEVFGAWSTPGSSFICQEFAYFYIALARASGLKAYEAFVEQDCYGDWNYHSCPGVFIGGKAVLADPVYSWFGAPHKRFALLDGIQTEAIYLCETHGLKECRIGCKLAPRLPIAQDCLFFCLATDSRWSEAGQQADVMVRLFPRSPATLHDRAVMAFHDGKLAQAMELVEKALNLASHDADSYNLLGAIYAQRGDTAKAKEAWQNASRYALNEEGAKSFKQAAISMDALEFCKRGYAQVTAGDWSGALTNYTRAVELTPEWAPAYAYRSDAEQRIGNLAAALADSSKAIQLQTNYVWAYQMLGRIHEILGHTNEAKAAYTNALRYSTNSNSEAAEALQRLDGGRNVQTLEEEVRAHPTNFQAAFDLAGAYVAIQNTDRANQILDGILSNPHVDDHAALTVAMAYNQMQNWAKLETTLEKIVRIMPENPEVWYDLAAFKGNAGKLGEAIPALRQALELSSKRLRSDPKAHDLAAEARRDSRFKSLQQSPEFKQLIDPR